jgi:plastocyanin
MDDYLLVAEDGHGLRVLELPGHRHHDDPLHGHTLSPTQVGFLPLQERISAVAASLRWIYVSGEGGLIVIDASVPSVPKFIRRLPLDLGSGVLALAANGSRVYLLSDQGLHMVDVSRTGDAATVETYPEVLGRAMSVVGRQLFIAGGDAGIRIFRDRTPTAATFFVQVGDIFFNPPGVVNVNAGDTVEWQKSSTGFPHNVFSCNPGQTGCGGATTTEVFTSGPVTTSPFNFSHTFTLAGSNPYVCQAHSLSMQGDIVVTGGPPSPPGVPDGSGATRPMTVAKLDTAGADLSIAYDTGCAGANGHDIIHGTGVHLPVAPGGSYASAGGRCGIGANSPFAWTATPSPLSGDFVWWLILAEDGSGTEGSWGKDSGGFERDGPGMNGASGQCGNTDKDLGNICGQ